MQRVLASLTTLIACTLACSRADAACSHAGSLSDQARAAALADALTVLKVDGPADLSDSPGPGRQQDPGRPCSGPNCSNRPAPSEIPFRVSPVTGEEWCLALAPLPRPVLTWVSHRHSDSPVTPSNDPPSIERPPRGR